jgi:glycosyltransferase involved in cell wall biosynthesis/peptidoglycan/xylan/chitin deacetylase (PgdA/CDA1 family)
MLTATPFSILKPIIPRRVQIMLRRMLINFKKSSCKDIWPIDPKSAKKPEGWKGWPESKKFSLVLTHDVDTQRGYDQCHLLAEIEERLGFRSSFNFVDEDLKISMALIKKLKEKGFEVGVHGIKHENPFKSKKIFQKQAVKINHYLKKWDSVGFRSPSMYHNLEWIHALNIDYDASTFDTDPFEPQPDGMGTIFPFWVAGDNGRQGYVELPYTLPQDFLIFIMLQQENINIWKQKLDWIVDNGGMALFISHPDYMDFNHSKHYEKYPVQYYEEFLTYIKTKYEGLYWHVLPNQVASFWKENYAYPQKTMKPSIRVCMLTYSFYTNDARVRRYAESLARRGDHVDVIALRGTNEKEYEILNGVHVYRNMERTRNEKGKLDYLIKMLNFLIHSSLNLTKKHFNMPYNLVHVHSVPDFEVFAAILQKLTGAKIILDIHDPVPDFFMAKFGGVKNEKYYKILSFFEKISSNFAHHVITVTDYWMGKIAERSKIPENKISVILNLPDIKMFNYANIKESRQSNEYFTILYPGTINKHCGLDIAIRAVHEVSKEIPKIKFQIYGGGPELDNVTQLVKDLELEDVVFFNGYVPLETIPAIMNKANLGIALLAGLNDYAQQALNVKLFEYLSMGLPAIATRTKSIEYYLKEGTVMLSEPNNPSDVARCIRDLYYDPGKRAELKKNGLAFIEINNSEIQMQKYLKIVDKLTEKSCP